MFDANLAWENVDIPDTEINKSFVAHGASIGRVSLYVLFAMKIRRYLTILLVIR